MSVIEAVLAVFTAVAGWFADTITALLPMFYVAETGLTFLGVISLASLGIGVICMLVGVITNFIKFRA